MTINTANKNSNTASHIPSFQGLGRSNSVNKKQYQQQQQDQQSSQLPHARNNNFSNATATINFKQNSFVGAANQQQQQQQHQQHHQPASNSGSSSSSSPISPPSVSYNINKDDSKLVTEMNRLYRKSPFMQKKFNGSSSSAQYRSPGDESPKKESVLSSIGKLEISF